MKLYIGMRLRPLMFLIFRESSIKGITLQYSVGFAKLSVELGFDNWGQINYLTTGKKCYSFHYSSVQRVHMYD